MVGENWVSSKVGRWVGRWVAGWAGMWAGRQAGRRVGSIGAPSGEIIDQKGVLINVKTQKQWSGRCTDHIYNNDFLVNYTNLSPAVA